MPNNNVKFLGIIFNRLNPKLNMSYTNYQYKKQYLNC